MRGCSSFVPLRRPSRAQDTDGQGALIERVSMFGYDLKPYELFGYPFFFGVLAVIVANIYPSDLMNVFCVAFEVHVAFAGSFYLYNEASKHIDSRGKNDTQKPANAPKEERPIVADLKLIPRSMAGGMVVNNQVIAGVKFNKVRRFAQTLLNMRSVSESSVDLREDTWRVHFGGRDGYIKTRIRFENVGAFIRKDARPNSPYIVSPGGWNVVQEVAHGNERVLQ